MPVLTGNGGVISVETPASPVPTIERPNPPTTSVAVTMRGGSGGGSGVEIQQASPASTWILTVPPSFGRRPNVAIYVAGVEVETDVTADSSTVSIQFPAPTAGSAVLT